MSRSFRTPLSLTAALAAALVALPCAVRPAAAQGVQASAAPAPDSATPPDTAAPAKKHKSRFGGFGHMFHKAAKGLTGETAKKIAITAATGGAGAAMLHESGKDAGTSSLAGRALDGGLPSLHHSGASTAADSAAGAPAAPATPGARGTPGTMPTMQAMPRAGAPGAPGTETDRALRASQELARLATLGAQGDADAKHAMDVVDSAMSAPKGDLATLEKRAINGDATASQELIIREAEIADAALPPGKRGLDAATAASGHAAPAHRPAHHPAPPRAHHRAGATPS